ncbi:EKC/KEOPS complex subunit Tp53rk [Octopus sinensis]|uniref:non-specific serine/threonine protein kinase n=1 Tax=Octopus sinensis TaxID=2607531 RepID=A0A6P7U7W1_9MOLL|nr:EKC/KEOPS complex subunit Tp53rk [Octopus sinensis]
MAVNGELGTLVKQGAEAKLYESLFYERPCIIKERFQKSYRHPSLDKSLTQQRLKSEVRAMLRCRMNGIPAPVVFFTNLENGCIYMEKILNSLTMKDYIRNCQQQNGGMQCASQFSPLVLKMGEMIGKMHQNNLIHGDLTTSNILVRGDPSNLDLVFIDFGLSHFENNAEDKGVDLYVLERALLSTHPNTEQVFTDILNGYKKGNEAGYADVLQKLEEVRLRGRKRTMVG